MRKVFKFLSISLFLFILSCSDESAVSDAQNIEFGFDTMFSHYSTKKGSSLQFNCKGAQSMDLIELYINEEKAETWTNPSSDKFETFDAVQFHLRKNDKLYKIYGFSGAILFGPSGEYYPESENECKIKKKEIEDEILNLFSNPDKRYESSIGYDFDPKVIRNDTYITLDNGDVWLQCYTFSKKPKKKKNLYDNLRVTILSSEFKKWMTTKAY